MKRFCIFLLAINGFAAAVATDVWDISEGITVNASSPLDSADGRPQPYDLRDIFGGEFGSYTPETGAVVFSDEVPIDYVHFVEWQTPEPVRVKSVRVFVGFETNGDRNIRTLLLKAKPLGETAFSRIVYYGWHQEENDSGATYEANVVPVLAQELRAEFLVNPFQINRGARIVEIDGFTEYLPIEIQEPLSIEKAVQVKWTADTNFFQVQWASKLDTNVWFDLGEPVQSDTITDAVQWDSNRFYRVLRLE